jgi:hypothetical protein
MQPHPKERYHSPKLMQDDIRPIKELLLMQSKGKFLTKGEKKRVTKYAEEQRKTRAKK